MLAAESGVAAAHGRALPLLRQRSRAKRRSAWLRANVHRHRLQTFLVKDTLLDEFLQELSEGSGSFLTRVR